MMKKNLLLFSNKMLYQSAVKIRQFLKLQKLFLIKLHLYSSVPQKPGACLKKIVRYPELSLIKPVFR